MKRYLILLFIQIISIQLFAGVKSIDINNEIALDTTYNGLIQQASDALNSNDVEKTLSLLNQAIQKDSTQIEAYVYKANLLADMKLYKEAILTNSKALQMKKTIELITFQVGLYIDAQKPNEALEFIDQNLQTEPQSGELLLLKGYVYSSINQPEKNNEIIDQIIKDKKTSNSSKVKAYYRRAIDYYNNNESKKALQDLKKAEKYADKEYELLEYIALIYNKMEEYSQSEKIIAKVLNAFENNNYTPKDIYFIIDLYSYTQDTLVKVIEYYDPKNANSNMEVQYEFCVFSKNEEEGYDFQYSIRLEGVMDILGMYKKNMQVMAKKSSNGFSTYWKTLNPKGTPYKEWKNNANKIIGNKFSSESGTKIGNSN